MKAEFADSKRNGLDIRKWFCSHAEKIFNEFLSEKRKTWKVFYPFSASSVGKSSREFREHKAWNGKFEEC